MSNKLNDCSIFLRAWFVSLFKLAAMNSVKHSDTVEVHNPTPVDVDFVKQLPDFLLVDLSLFEEMEATVHFLEGKHAVPVLVENLEGLHHFLLLLGGQDLQGNKLQHGSLQFILGWEQGEFIEHILVELLEVLVVLDPRMGEGLFCWNALLGLGFEHFLDEFLSRVWDLFPFFAVEGEGAGLDFLEQVFFDGGVEGRVAAEHEVKYDSDGPDVALLVVAVSEQDFRRNVVWLIMASILFQFCESWANLRPPTVSRWLQSRWFWGCYSATPCRTGCSAASSPGARSVSSGSTRSLTGSTWCNSQPSSRWTSSAVSAVRTAHRPNSTLRWGSSTLSPGKPQAASRCWDGRFGLKSGFPAATRTRTFWPWFSQWSSWLFWVLLTGCLLVSLCSTR